ncbi:MAG: DUF1852 family protein, partial [Brevundimonas sp.]|nr:DUF1852 family protein [Brevundimonas sp.]
MQSSDFTFDIRRTALDEDYRPAENTRITTNFANLARGESRQENLRNTLRMIDNRFNSLAHRDNPRGDRYAVELQIISVEMSVSAEDGGAAFPLIEILQTTILDGQTGARIDGIVGNNFSSYVRDYDFSVVLPAHMKANPGAFAPADFGDLHGKLFRHFLSSGAYRDNFRKPPVICLSVSSNKTYHRTGVEHPVLGLEYDNDEFSPTDRYFAKMGMKVRYFMPGGSAAPFAFYHIGDLTAD